MIAMGGILVATCASTDAQSKTYRDRYGKVVGKSTTDSRGKEVIRDKSGKLIGTGTKSGNTTTYRDSKGRIITKETTKPDPKKLEKKK